VTTDTASTVSRQASRSKSARDDQTTGQDSFAALVDSNTANNANAASAPVTSAPTPARADDRSSADARSTRDDSRAASASAADARDRDAQANKATDAAKDAKADAADAKAATDDQKAPAKDANSSDKDASKTDADKPAEGEQGKDTVAATATPVTTAPVAVAVAVVAPVAPATADPTAAPAVTEAAGASQPATLAAAALAAKATTGEATVTATAEQTAATGATAASDEDFAAIIAAATPVAGKAGLKQAGKSTDGTEAATTAKSATADPSATTTATQPANGTTAPTTGTKPSGANSDGAKPDAAPIEPATAKTAGAAGHERHSADAAALGNQVDAGQLAANNVQQQPVQPSATDTAPALQLTATAAPTAPVPLNGIAVQIAATAQAGNTRFEIRLDPAELGRIDVRLDVDRHGNVTSHLTVEKPETLAMLRQDAPQLQRALEQAGMKSADGGLQFSLRDQSSSGQQNGNGQNPNSESGRNAQRLIVTEDNAIPAAVAGRNYGRMLGSSSGVDIRI
jgi:chemotaxis protein MotD